MTFIPKNSSLRELFCSKSVENKNITQSAAVHWTFPLAGVLHSSMTPEGFDYQHQV
jgi:hypothetical protein